MDIYKINRLEQKKWSQKYKKILIVLIKKDFAKSTLWGRKRQNKGVRLDTYNKSVQHQ